MNLYWLELQYWNHSEVNLNVYYLLDVVCDDVDVVDDDDDGDDEEEEDDDDEINLLF